MHVNQKHKSVLLSLINNAFITNTIFRECVANEMQVGLKSLTESANTGIFLIRHG